MRKWVPGVLVAYSWVLSLAVYSRLPERVATHWDLYGTPDRTDDRLIGAFVVPALMLLVWALARVLPSTSGASGAKETRPMPEPLRESYETMLVVVVAFLGLIHVGIIGHALGWGFGVPQVLPLGVGAMLVVMGHMLPRLQRSWYVGIRLPWTLASERVWERTHRVGGHILTWCGIAVALATFVEGLLSSVIVIGGLVLAALSTLAYSYRAWREEGSPVHRE